MRQYSSDPEESGGAELTRRDILRWSLMGFGIAALGPLTRASMALAAGPSGKKILVVINLKGGNDGLNTVVPITLSSYAIRRANLALPSSACLSMNTGPTPTTDYMLHPELDNLAQLWAEGSVAVIRRVGYPKTNLSHFTSKDIWSKGVRDGFAALGVGESGWIARYADAEAPTAMGAVSLGMGQPLDFIGGASDPTAVWSLSSFRYYVDWSYSNNHTHRLNVIRDMLANYQGAGIAAEIKTALAQGHALSDDIQQAVTSYTSSVTYSTESPSRFLRDIAILIQAGFETRVFYTGFGGFDTHGGQGTVTGKHADLLRRFDDGLGSFVADLKAMGVWNNVAIAVISEFGRRNYENGSGGTDHGHGNHLLVLGGAVNGGLYGPALTDADLQEEYLSYEVDFRSIYKEILTKHLGMLNVGSIFPESQTKDVTLGIL